METLLILYYLKILFHFGILLLIYCGFIAGYVLVRIAPEEYGPSKKNVMKLAKTSIILGCLVFAYFFYATELLLSVLAGLYAIVCLFRWHRYRWFICYGIFGLFIGLSVNKSPAFVLLCVFALSFALFHGILEGEKKFAWKIFLANSVLLVTGMLAYFL